MCVGGVCVGVGVSGWVLMGCGCNVFVGVSAGVDVGVGVGGFGMCL